MSQICYKNSVYLNSSNPVKAAEEIRKVITKSDIQNLELDLSGMNVLDAVKVLAMTSSYLYNKLPDRKLRFRFMSSDIKNILSGLSLKNLEMVV